MDKLHQAFNGQLQQNFPLKQVTTLQIGGPAQALIIAKTQEELTRAVQLAKEENLKFLVIGGGSNLLVSDEGFPGLIIKNEVVGIESNRSISHIGGVTVTAQSGTVLQDVVNFAVEKGLSGLQKLTGIPGTLGGAVYGNAGAYGQTISDKILEVTGFNGQKVVHLSKEECQFSYRDSGFKRNGLIILQVKFILDSADQKILAQEATEVLSQRLIRYPKGLLCPGSFFKNVLVENISPQTLTHIPPEKITYGKVTAGALLEMVEAKGQKLGNIQISPNHGNLIINLGEGKASDFYQLASQYAQKVKEKFNIQLEPEVQLINLPPLSIKTPNK